MSFSDHFVPYHKVNSCFIRPSLNVIFFIVAFSMSLPELMNSLKLIELYLTIKKTACLTTTMIGYSPRSFMRRKKYQKIKQVCRYGHLILYSWTRKLKHNIIQFMKGRLFFLVRILLRTSELSSYFFSFSTTDVLKKCHSPNPSLDLSLQYKSIASDTTVSQ